MGRPPLGKTAMTDAERQRRHRSKLDVTKPTEPVTKPSAGQTAAGSPGDIRITALEQENAKLRVKFDQAEARIRELAQGDHPQAAKSQRPVARSDAKGDTLACKLIRNLGEEKDHLVIQAARALVSELKRIGADLHDLSDAWKPVEQKLTAPRPRPIDFAKVEEVVKRYAQGKTGVGFGPVLDRVEAAVPETNWRAQNANREIMHTVHEAVAGYLYRLGFKPTSANKDRWKKQ